VKCDVPVACSIVRGDALLVYCGRVTRGEGGSDECDEWQVLALGSRLPVESHTLLHLQTRSIHIFCKTRTGQGEPPHRGCTRMLRVRVLTPS
jgi:hypothetical protein